MTAWSDTQSATLAAVVDTFTGPLTVSDASRLVTEHLATLRDHAAPHQTQTRDGLMALAQVDPMELDVLESFKTLLNDLPKDKVRDISRVLDLLATGWGTMLLTGSRMAPFHELDRLEREAAMNTLARSRLSIVRSLFLAFKALTVLPTYATAATVDGAPSPFWAPLEYPGVPAKDPEMEPAWVPRFEDIEALAKEAGDGNPIELETDVVVVGSGAGGGVVAAELAQAGYRVLVLEKGVYYNPVDDPFTELESLRQKFENGCIVIPDDGSVLFLAGATWGGGTAVNWSASFRLPYNVRQEWATQHRLPYFASPAYEAAINAVWARAGVSDSHFCHSGANQVLEDGATALGMGVAKIAQNTNGAAHDCGFCNLGCPTSEKQSSAVTWLKDAQDANAKFIQGCHVDRVTYSHEKIATGVEATVLNGSVKLIVKASTVIAAAGSLHTPALLLRSGLTNPNIGKHLRIHPVSSVHGFVPSKLIQPWAGAIMTSVCTQLADLHGDGYGVRLEVPSSILGMLSTILPWRSNADHKRLVMQYPRTASFIALVRDCDTVSRVTIDADGRPRISVSLGSKDALSVQEGLIAGAKILLAQGAVEVNTTHFDLPPLQLRSKDDLANPIECATTQNWFALVRARGVVQNRIGLFNAHQMGSCRMSASPDDGAVNPDGETWDVKGLYVADASLFPTSSGVNPMMTTFAMGYSVAQFIKANLAAEKSHPTGKLRKVWPATPWWQRVFRDPTAFAVVALLWLLGGKHFWTTRLRALLGRP
ncbi:hypothetical protein SPRG_02132 [Saprolegnia parasitica CBS 223.65]|uniref:Long-chain-alcohol oxidase n=1 Tax=Saprolegnia parasitica (strain CBS 223.65) TaxID=695850 RepID=A0A067CS50_SAPPC|nr:hypothetical protein SPRG_02132 [Saprolegnia parasitica CBS 223.65]KDO33323.1 hypothetical protein SPRG_02132 [Saprolegnia parasitica CBS 223.65]|eukprot:XP_012196073.1 hypothetical protein SPRG_02132 [Saprolegnia parasitica CBS 223.65]